MTALNLTATVDKQSTGQRFGTSYTYTAVNDYEESGILQIGTTEGSVAIALANPGIVFVQNRFDPTIEPANYVEVGLATGDYDLRLFPGQSAWWPLAGAPASITIYAVFQSQDGNLQYAVWSAKS